MDTLANKEPPVKDMIKYLREISRGFERAQLFYTAFELDVFNLLKQPKAASEVSKSLGTSPALTEKTLDALVAMGLLECEDKQYRTGTQVYPFLVKDEPYYARYLQSSLENRRYWLSLPDILKTGPAVKKEKEEPKPERDPVAERDWVEYIARYSMLGRLQATVKSIARRPEFKNARRVLDLGGCHGLFAIALAQENEAVHAIVFDRPWMTGYAEEYIRAHDMHGHVTTMAGDYTKDDIGTGYDVVLALCTIGGGREQVEQIYDKVAASLNPGGLFIISDFPLDDDGKGPLQAITWDIEGLMRGNDGFRRLKIFEIADRLERHGFNVDDVIDLYGTVDVPMRLVIAKKK